MIGIALELSTRSPIDHQNIICSAAGIEPLFENDLNAFFTGPNPLNEEVAAVWQRMSDAICQQLATSELERLTVK